MKSQEELLIAERDRLLEYNRKLRTELAAYKRYAYLLDVMIQTETFIGNLFKPNRKEEKAND